MIVKSSSSSYSFLDSNNENEDDNIHRNFTSHHVNNISVPDSTDTRHTMDTDSVNSKDTTHEDMVTVFRGTKGSKKKHASHKEYKVKDNRDALPFQIQVQIPPPDDYSMIRQTKKSSLTTSTKSITSISSKKREDTIMSTIYRNKGQAPDSKNNANDDDNDDAYKVLIGDYQLDASTTTGDTIVIQTTVYRVIRHRCLYQYKQKQFQMCRKILEVKELNRYLSEQYIQQQFNK